ncbi:MAG: Lrp/AsnC family transcriptional regulator [Desulfobacterales bacterium]|nr:Lrp/AsnC family transcriptional regulator [Desulfobacterales bacterium]
MDPKKNKLLDEIGQGILKILESDARMPYSRIGRMVGLSTPAVTERVRKMEEAGIILGYYTRVCKEDSRETVTAFIELETQVAHYNRVKQEANCLAQVLECHHISGQAAFIIKVRVASVTDLEDVVAKFSPFGKTRTSIVLSSSKEPE